MRKKLLVTVLTMAAMLSISMVCSAAYTEFSKEFVDSNQWGYLASDWKENNSTIGKVWITKLYDANGNEASNYKQLKVRVSGTDAAVTVTKGKWCNVPLTFDYRLAGQYVSLDGMGNNPSLDCYASGAWDAD